MKILEKYKQWCGTKQSGSMYEFFEWLDESSAPESGQNWKRFEEQIQVHVDRILRDKGMSNRDVYLAIKDAFNENRFPAPESGGEEKDVKKWVKEQADEYAFNIPAKLDDSGKANGYMGFQAGANAMYNHLKYFVPNKSNSDVTPVASHSVYDNNCIELKKILVFAPADGKPHIEKITVNENDSTIEWIEQPFSNSIEQ